MNRHLQTILNFIQASQNLTAEEKATLKEAAEDAGNDLDITAFKLDRTEKVKHTTSILLEETIEELEQKRAAVEEKACELEIESALERVRTVAMSMGQQGDLLNICETMFHALERLGFDALRNAMIDIHYDEKSYLLNYDYSQATGKTITRFVYNSHPMVDNLIRHAQHSREAFTEMVYAGKDLEEWKAFRRTNGEADDPRMEGIDSLHYYFYSIGRGAVGISTFEAASPEQLAILKRFRNVFDLAYRRFEDITRAEAQAREAQIEAALERVRSQTMAMNRSEDLREVVSAIFSEIDGLELKTLRCGIGIIDGATRTVSVWTTSTTNEGLDIHFAGNESMDIHPLMQGSFAAWERGEDAFYTLEGADLLNYYATQKGINYSLPATAAGIDVSANDRQFYFCTYFSAGGLYFFRGIPFTDDLVKIIRRFAAAFSLAYKRFEDLKQSEARAAEAVKEASLDRVRAEIASMRTTTDLERITPLIWKELTALGVPFIRCGVFIMDDAQQAIHTFLATPNGKAIAAFNLPYATSGNIARIVEHWRLAEIYADHWDEAAFLSFADALVQQGAFPSAQQYLETLPHGGFYLHFTPFLQGMLYVGNMAPLGEEERALTASIADAFSSAYARYEDFSKLEAAKRQVDETLTHLKQTQQQLVQAEKMASLGELTAGIAHEIQNPLNFVNNFSDVNKDLLEELKAEADNGNLNEVKAIANDVIENSDKINFHGRRADAIVKGMLQHSRISTGKKEATDINGLCDEYLKLAYHGFRGKDKNFNTVIKTEFDSSIEKLNIIPQDIGRVLLNIFNNAFYAVNEKSKGRFENYKPSVLVKTKQYADRVEITVADNGDGIPQKVIDKIFQPFFTTKPTGEGTGLGLSLAYDIVKAHGGTIEVERREDEGTTFITKLTTTT